MNSKPIYVKQVIFECTLWTVIGFFSWGRHSCSRGKSSKLVQENFVRKGNQSINRIIFIDTTVTGVSHCYHENSSISMVTMVTPNWHDYFFKFRIFKLFPNIIRLVFLWQQRRDLASDNSKKETWRSTDGTFKKHKKWTGGVYPQGSTNQHEASKFLKTIPSLRLVDQTKEKHNFSVNQQGKLFLLVSKSILIILSVLEPKRIVVFSKEMYLITKYYYFWMLEKIQFISLIHLTSKLWIILKRGLIFSCSADIWKNHNLFELEWLSNKNFPIKKNVKNFGIGDFGTLNDKTEFTNESKCTRSK